MAALLQYARSDDPEVLHAVEQNALDRSAAVQQCLRFARKYGAHRDRFYADRRGGGIGVAGLPFLLGADGEGQPPKGWVRGSLPHDGRRPRARTPEEAEMRSLRWNRQPVPGMPEWCESRTDERTGGFYWMTPMPFIHEDRAWVLLSEVPTLGEFGEQWHEVLASEANAARAAYLAEHVAELAHG